MNRRNTALLVLIAALVIVPITGVVVGQSAGTPDSTPTPATENATETKTPEPTPTPTPDRSQIEGTGPHKIYDLKNGGTHDGMESIPSLRALGDPPQGFVAVRYRNPTLIDAITGGKGSWAQVQPRRTVKQDRIQMYGSAFGDTAGEYDIVVVYWDRQTVDVNGTDVPYAANQTVERHTVDFEKDDLYTYRNITLQHHTERTWMVTMWLERDGEGVDGARWRFRHRSNPESSAVSISSQAEAWGFAARNAVLPGMASLILGLVAAKGTLERIGRGPGYGIGSWLMIVLIVGVIVAMIAYYQIAVILNNLPWVMGISIGFVAYAAGLTFHQPVKHIGFMRRELTDAVTIPGGSPVHKMGEATPDGGETAMSVAESAAAKLFSEDDGGAEVFDELTESLFIDLPEIPIVRTDKGYRVPIKGVKPAAARLFAKAALLDVSNIATRQRVRMGRLSDIIFVEPFSEEPVEHKPARLVRVLPWDTVGEDPTLGEEIVAAALSAVIIIFPPMAGFMIFDRLANIAWVGFFAGVVVTLVLAYTAEDGWIDFEPAPPHYVRAEDNLTALQRAYRESKEDMTAKEEAWTERATTAKEAREEKSDEQRNVTDELLDSLGADSATDGDGESDREKGDRAEDFELSDEDEDEESRD